MHYPFHAYLVAKDIRRAASAGDVDAAFRHGQAVAIARCLTSELMGGASAPGISRSSASMSGAGSPNE
jgi:hypothetical protein